MYTRSKCHAGKLRGGAIVARENDGFGGTLLFVTGVALGAFLGVLLAPHSGTDTREKLADWLKERRKQGDELLRAVKEDPL